MPKTVVIFGATGKQGGSIVDAFLNDASFKVRSIVRDPGTEAAKRLQARGVEVVKGDLFDEASLVKAFQGANIIYGATADIGVLLPQLLNSGTQSIVEKAYRLEKIEGKNLVHAVAAVQDTLELFIFSCLSAARQLSGGEFKTIYHFDAKAETIQYLESNYPELVPKTVELQLGMFATNTLVAGPVRPAKQPDGRYRVLMPHAVDTAVPFIDPNRDPAIFVKAIASQPLPSSSTKTKVLKLAGYAQSTTYRRFVELLNEHVPGEFYFEETSIEAWAPLIPIPGFGLELAQMWKYNEKIGYFGGQNGGTRRITELKLEQEPTKMEDWIKNQDWSFLNQE